MLDPQNNRATVEGKPVYEQPINRKHLHRIYFDPNGTPPPKPVENKPAPMNLGPTSAPATTP